MKKGGQSPCPHDDEDKGFFLTFLAVRSGILQARGLSENLNDRDPQIPAPCPCTVNKYFPWLFIHKKRLNGKKTHIFERILYLKRKHIHKKENSTINYPDDSSKA